MGMPVLHSTLANIFTLLLGILFLVHASKHGIGAGCPLRGCAVIQAVVDPFYKSHAMSFVLLSIHTPKSMAAVAHQRLKPAQLLGMALAFFITGVIFVNEVFPGLQLVLPYVSRTQLSRAITVTRRGFLDSLPRTTPISSLRYTLVHVL